MNSDKIGPEHLQRRAVVYVRQSTPDQVRHHVQSRERQYELAHQARGMGWQDVEIIDDDMGRSGATSAGRAGFRRLVAAVCLREVGAVFSLEASGLARNNRDWYQLVDFCGLSGTLIVDFDGIYDPRLLNDRLLLGLKGTMSEFELGLIRQRALEALHRMAAQGILFTTVPVGFVRSGDGRCEKDPDLRVQHSIDLVFTQFARCGSARQVLLWFRQEGVPLPVATYGTNGRRLVWRLPAYGTILRILTNPTCAGAYAYGRTTTTTRMVDSQPIKSRGERRRQEDWEVLLPNHHAGYVSWDVYQRNQAQIRANANMKGSMVRGPALTGRSLVAGLLRCRRCGRRLHVTYSGANHHVPRYNCVGAHLNQGGARCISFGGLAVDRAIEREVLRVVEPGAIEAALAALKEVRGQADERHRALELALQQARYEADRAHRQYDAVEPENRLVGAELERRWNEALRQVHELEVQTERLPAPRNSLSDSDRRALMSLGHDFPSVWRDPRSDMRLKKRLVRVLIEEILADVDDQQAVVDLVIRWAGGAHTRLAVRKYRVGQHRHSTDGDVVELVRNLAAIVPDRTMANILNRLRLRTARGNTWTELRVRAMRSAHHIPVYRSDRPRDWFTLEEAADRLQVSPMSVKRLIQTRVLPARQVVPYAPWMIMPESLLLASVAGAVTAIRQGRRRSPPEDPAQQRLDLTGV